MKISSKCFRTITRIQKLLDENQEKYIDGHVTAEIEFEKNPDDFLANSFGYVTDMAIKFFKRYYVGVYQLRVGVMNGVYPPYKANFYAFDGLDKSKVLFVEIVGFGKMEYLKFNDNDITNAFDIFEKIVDEWLMEKGVSKQETICNLTKSAKNLHLINLLD